MSNTKTGGLIADRTACITFALYHDTPIACQGDDDPKKIEVIRQTLAMNAETHANAQQRAAELGVLHDSFVQVWHVEPNQ